ncbi:MAG: exosortase/archaeosortase family protein [Nanohaloarchaea archaeon]|nr:exosortase/archaeosortase family protein [Candidatus Nanohaloarchaea archaeon]
MFEPENEKQRKLLETSKFIGKLVLAGIIFQILLFLGVDLEPFQELLAHITSSLLSFLGIDFTVQGYLLVGETVDYLITRDCTGWKSVAAFTGLMFASEGHRNWKYLASGVLLIQLVNVLRIVTTVYLSYTGIISFDIIHSIFWRWGLTFVVLVLWGLWLFESR